MQIRIFSIPIPGGETAEKELNSFLRSKKILQVESELVQTSRHAFWCFCVRYIEDAVREAKNEKVDYKKVLDAESFDRFSRLREIRKQIAREEAIPAYAIFTNEELSQLARLPELTLAAMKKVKGIGAKKIEKYGAFFSSTKPDTNETG